MKVLFLAKPSGKNGVFGRQLYMGDCSLLQVHACTQAMFLQETLCAHVQITLLRCTAGHQSTGIIALITILQ